MLNNNLVEVKHNSSMRKPGREKTASQHLLRFGRFGDLLKNKMWSCQATNAP
jgi:hypothetical protein